MSCLFNPKLIGIVLDYLEELIARNSTPQLKMKWNLLLEPVLALREIMVNIYAGLKVAQQLTPGGGTHVESLISAASARLFNGSFIFKHLGFLLREFSAYRNSYQYLEALVELTHYTAVLGKDAADTRDDSISIESALLKSRSLGTGDEEENENENRNEYRNEYGSDGFLEENAARSTKTQSEEEKEKAGMAKKKTENDEKRQKDDQNPNESPRTRNRRNSPGGGSVQIPLSEIFAEVPKSCSTVDHKFRGVLGPICHSKAATTYAHLMKCYQSNTARANKTLLGVVELVAKGAEHRALFYRAPFLALFQTILRDKKRDAFKEFAYLIVESFFVDLERYPYLAVDALFVVSRRVGAQIERGDYGLNRPAEDSEESAAGDDYEEVLKDRDFIERGPLVQETRKERTHERSPARKPREPLGQLMSSGGSKEDDKREAEFE